MKTIRRIYFYAVALISMEVVLWGMIGLARSIFSNSSSGGVSQLSEALALILVGVPVFGIQIIQCKFLRLRIVSVSFNR